MKLKRKAGQLYAIPMFFSLILILCLSTTNFSQTLKSDETLDSIPEQAMRRVVRGILISYFKPSKRKKVIYLDGERLQKSWLPKIEGIEFQLLSTREDSYIPHYLFTALKELSKDKYEIGFGFGSAGSGYEGDNWTFRVSKRSVRLMKQRNTGWGASGIDTGPDADK